MHMKWGTVTVAVNVNVSHVLKRYLIFDISDVIKIIPIVKMISTHLSVNVMSESCLTVIL